MDKFNDFQRSRAWRIALFEARRRFGVLGRVGAVILITMLATLLFTGHRAAPECVRAFVCFERSSE